MLEELLKLDQQLFVFLNGLGSATYDSFWLLITKKTSWIPVFAIILYLVFKHLGWRHALLILVIVAAVLTVCDQTTNLVKNSIQRLRPGNNPELEHVMRIVQKRNSYSFFSGHASNSMAVALLLFLIMRRYVKYMGFIFLWPLIFAYSRIYLGLHYPLDIFCGYCFGILIGFIFFELYRFSRNRFFPEQKENLDNPTNT